MTIKNRSLKWIKTALASSWAVFVWAQSPLYIPPVLTGPVFDLQVQSGTTQFFPQAATTTYGVNGALLAPTIVVNKGDFVSLQVTNNLNDETTMHWHGLHVSPENDGGPHQAIQPGQTWSPQFEILNRAGTFWYHPHGHMRTDFQVSKGIAGFFIIHDPEEQALNLPKTYGVDDFPLAIQSKAFDVFTQISVSTGMDTVMMVNGTIDPYLQVPAQVIRLRLLNGSSLRAYNFGFDNNQTYYQIASDGGLTAQPNTMTRLIMAPGERNEILLDLSGMEGQSIKLIAYNSELPAGIYGASVLGDAQNEVHDYDQNFLNGTNHELLELRIGAPTANPVQSIPGNLVAINPFNPLDAEVERTLILDTVAEFASITPNLAEGPFGINYELFDMDVVNIEVQLGATEIWKLVNKTMIAHPFHIHDILFNVIEKSGTTPPVWEQGWKDVVLVPANDSVRFITRFTTFASEHVPYMYHCHLLHHEDDGMMGTFLVKDTSLNVTHHQNKQGITVYPNPSATAWVIRGLNKNEQFNLRSASGSVLQFPTHFWDDEVLYLDNRQLASGCYFLEVEGASGKQMIPVMKTH